VSLIAELFALYGWRLEFESSDLVCDYSAESTVSDSVILLKRKLEGLAIHNNVIIEGVQQLGSGLFGQSIAMIHGIESSPVKVYRYFPILFPLQNGSGLRWDLIIPNQIDLRYVLGIAFRFCVLLKIFFQDREITVSWMRHGKQPKPWLERMYLVVSWWVWRMRRRRRRIDNNGRVMGRFIKLSYINN
jgi:hypothetical protein